ncbi:hypothetical protein L227DRAFT_568433 [Lentinus tigrinus ALCF2SS1-6]|uniref:Uncharacterized protein n=1 Tax=Lentinus tigrinus ALCF2SS1-6 TaxID=1328759 RepID=A0A5C2RMD1_9APHY|nr:hypothetical protein L227DRAFT_568433 [Lentinus tigrinus ALCF2SS1-6]
MLTAKDESLYTISEAVTISNSEGKSEVRSPMVRGNEDFGEVIDQRPKSRRCLQFAEVRQEAPEFIPEQATNKRVKQRVRNRDENRSGGYTAEMTERKQLNWAILAITYPQLGRCCLKGTVFEEKCREAGFVSDMEAGHTMCARGGCAWVDASKTIRHEKGEGDVGEARLRDISEGWPVSGEVL